MSQPPIANEKLYAGIRWPLTAAAVAVAGADDARLVAAPADTAGLFSLLMTSNQSPSSSAGSLLLLPWPRAADPARFVEVALICGGGELTPLRSPVMASRSPLTASTAVFAEPSAWSEERAEDAVGEEVFSSLSG